MSFYEVTDFLIFARHAPFIATAVANEEFLESLSPERRAMVLETVAELREYNLDVQQRFNAERLDLIKERKPSLEIIESLTDEERAAFREASRPVRDRFLALAGPRGAEVLEIVLRAGERASR